MKLSKKLIAAIGMLTLSAVMLVTSSFAWFSMNDKVTANGMTVTAKGDQVYLQIVAEGASFTNGAAQTSAVAKNASATLLPVAPRTENAEYAGAGAPTWVTATGTTPSNGAIAPGTNYTAAANSETVTYYLENTFQVRLDPVAGKKEAPGKLRVEAIGLNAPDAEFSKCLAVVVVCEYDGKTMGEYWKNTGAYDGELAEGEYNFNLASTDSDNALTEGKFGDKVATVKVYVFFDGENAACTLTNLAGAAEASFSVDVKFTVA